MHLESVPAQIESQTAVLSDLYQYKAPGMDKMGVDEFPNFMRVVQFPIGHYQYCEGMPGNGSPQLEGGWKGKCSLYSSQS